MVLGDSQPALYKTIKVMRKTKSAKLPQARGDWGKVMTNVVWDPEPKEDICG